MQHSSHSLGCNGAAWLFFYRPVSSGTTEVLDAHRWRCNLQSVWGNKTKSWCINSQSVAYGHQSMWLSRLVFFRVIKQCKDEANEYSDTIYCLPGFRLLRDKVLLRSKCVRLQANYKIRRRSMMQRQQSLFGLSEKSCEAYRDQLTIWRGSTYGSCEGLRRYLIAQGGCMAGWWFLWNWSGWDWRGCDEWLLKGWNRLFLSHFEGRILVEEDVGVVISMLIWYFRVESIGIRIFRDLDIDKWCFCTWNIIPKAIILSTDKNNCWHSQ